VINNREWTRNGDREWTRMDANKKRQNNRRWTQIGVATRSSEHSG
jgi:hypothetical protein